MSYGIQDDIKAYVDQFDFSQWDDDEYGLFNYKTRNGRFDFTFDLRPTYAGNDEVRIYIIEQPGYGGRSENGHATHRYGLTDGRPYVCVKRGEEPTNVPDALSWAVYWAESTSDYILTGREFS